MDTNTDTTDNETSTPRPYWHSPPLDFATAAQVWAAAAGVNGAYYPDFFERIVDALEERQSNPLSLASLVYPAPATPVVTYADLDYLHDAAYFAARAMANVVDRWDGPIGRAEIWRESDTEYGLGWITSVSTILVTYDGGATWRVEIFGVHVQRASAAQIALDSVTREAP